MGRTLYLSEHKGLRIQRDGPSLWIEMPGKAGRRVPVALIERVVVIGKVNLDSLIITLFAEYEIPVTFFNRRGEEMAVTIAYNHRFAEHYHRQKIFFLSEHNTERFMNILRSWRRRLQLDVIRRLSRRLAEEYEEKGLRERDYQKFVRFATLLYGKEYHYVQNIVSGLFREMIIPRLQKAGLDPHLGVLHRRRNFGLALDICHMLGAEEDMQSIQFFKKSKGRTLVTGTGVTSEGMRDIVIRFENRLKTMVNITERIIDDIFEAMRELETEANIRIPDRDMRDEDELPCLL